MARSKRCVKKQLHSPFTFTHPNDFVNAPYWPRNSANSSDAFQIQAPGQMEQRNPSKHEQVVCRYNQPSGADVSKAIDAALAAKPAWEALPFADRASVFLKAADLIGGKYRYEIMAATMIGQGKNAWQAEIDAAAEICDFFRSVYGRLQSHYHI